MTTRHDAKDDRTLQDDRAELDADPHEESPLAEGEGAPLAEDDVLRDDKPVTTQGLLGGAPVVTIVEEERPASGLTARDDRPIDD